MLIADFERAAQSSSGSSCVLRGFAFLCLLTFSSSPWLHLSTLERAAPAALCPPTFLTKISLESFLEYLLWLQICCPRKGLGGVKKVAALAHHTPAPALIAGPVMLSCYSSEGTKP